MIKENKRVLIVTSIFILLPILFGLFFWNQLPDQVATHFNAQGEADNFSSKAFAVIGLPLIILALHWLCVLGTSADPKKQNINGKILRLVLWICPLVSLFCTALMYAHAFGIDANVEIFVMLLVGVMFIIIGNYLPKCRQSYTMGIKLPWTLADEENWNKTHRMAGPLWMIGGALVLLSVFFPGSGFYVLLPVILIMVLVPMVYSYLLYKKKNG